MLGTREEEMREQMKNAAERQAYERGRLDGIAEERRAIMEYVTGPVREQFRGVERSGLGPEDAYDDVREMLRARARGKQVIFSKGPSSQKR